MSSKYGLVKAAAAYVLSKESAHEQVMDLLSYYDIDVERMAASNANAGAVLERSFDQLADFIRQGRVEVVRAADGRVTVKQHVTGTDPLVYGELGAKHKLAMDRCKEGENYQRMYNLMGSLCGLGSAAIEKLPARDLAVVEVLSTVFSNA